MEMLNFLLFIIIGVGITNLAVNATVLDYPRDFIINFVEDKWYLSWISKLITCMMCSGFWVGALLSFDDLIFLNPVYAGAIISLSSQAFGSFMEILDISIIYMGYFIENNEIEVAEEINETI